MDLCSLHIISNNQGVLKPKYFHFLRRASFIIAGRLDSFVCEYGGIWRTRSSKLTILRDRSIIARAKGNLNREDFSSSEDSDRLKRDGSEGSNLASDRPEGNMLNAPLSQYIISDWREFRANLIAMEQAQMLDADMFSKDPMSCKPSIELRSKWAHVISVPETGCILVATDKLDKFHTFARTVVLLLRSGDVREGPFGIVINRPLDKKISHMQPCNDDLASIFANCSVYSGGPLEASMFLLKQSDRTCQFSLFDMVVPNLYFGVSCMLGEAAELVKMGVLKAQDFIFFEGCTGWQFDQLRKEIESEYWIMAACSTNLLSNNSLDDCSGLWEEILQLIGGPYLELSQRPMQDGT